MTPAQAAQARSHAYAILGRVLVAGPSEETVALLRQLPGLATYLPDDFDIDPCAAEHHRLFSLEVFPYAGVFLNDEALIGLHDGDLQRGYARGGFTPKLSDVSPDHLGVQFSYLSFLLGAEADAHEDGVTDAIGQLHSLQHNFIDGHLMTWLPPLLAAIRQQPPSLWTQVVEIGVELTIDHRQQLGQFAGADSDSDNNDSAAQPTSSASTDARATDADLPDDGDAPDLTDEDTALRHIIDYLLVPKTSGVLLTRGAIVMLGRSDELPSGFGSRAITLRNLILSATKYQALPGLIEHMVDLVEQHAAVYEELAAMGSVAPAAQVWRQRARRTVGMLENMKEMRQAPGGDDGASEPVG